MTATCKWCGRPFETGRRHGTERRFCSAACRTAFHTEVRRWALLALDRGEVTVAQIRNDPRKACTLQGEAPGLPAVSESGAASGEACASSQRTGCQAGASIQRDGGAAKSARKYRARSEGAAGRSQAPRPVLSQAAQRAFIRSYLATGRWSNEWGPPPGDPACWVDSEIRDEYADVLGEMTFDVPCGGYDE